MEEDAALAAPETSTDGATEEEETNGTALDEKKSSPNNLSEKSLSKISSLYEKYSVLCTEVERLEKQNSEYRDQMVRLIRDRDHHESQLEAARNESTGKLQELERRALELEYQLKASRDRALAQEMHSAKIAAEEKNRFNQQIMQMTKKNEVCEREKNDSVIKYAQREAELMRMRSEQEKMKERIGVLIMERDRVLESSSEESRASLQKSLDEERTECARQKEEIARLEKEMKMAEKRLQVAHSTIQETKWQLETANRQIARLTEERDAVRSDYRKLITQLQSNEQEKCREEDAKKREASDRDESIRSLVEELSRTRDRANEMSRQIDALSNENSTLQSTCARMRLESAEIGEQFANARSRLEQLERIEEQVNRSQRLAENAQREKDEAVQEREQAETEAEECRAQAERMLHITEQLTEKNSRLTAECDHLRNKNRELNARIADLEEETLRITSRCDDAERRLQQDGACSTAEINSLQEQLNEQIARVQALTKSLEDAENDKTLMKKKQAANLKELRAELAILQRQPPPAVSASGSGHENGLTVGSGGVDSGGPLSRTSSITSLDQGGSRPALPVSREQQMDVQQAMIDKIVKLQRQLARRQDKIEFLEEHVKQCVDELQKKTKEEASLLLPEEHDAKRMMELFEMVEVPMTRRGATTSSHSLMGAMFMGSGNADRRSAVELATEVNARLEAVIEDLLIKNIALKNNVDTLGEEISRLSRENRHMSLSIFKEKQEN